MTGEKGTADAGTVLGHGAGTGPVPWHPDPRIRAVVILERQADAAWFLERYPGAAGDLRIASAGPGASWELEQRGLSFTPIETYAGVQGLVDLGMENFRRVDGFCSGIDTFMGGRYPLLREHGCTPARDTFFFAKILFDGLTVRIAYLQGLLEQEKPAVVVTAGCPVPRGPAGEVPFHPAESVFGRILSGGDWPCLHQHLVTPGTGEPAGQAEGRIPAPLRAFAAGIAGLQDTLSLAREGRWRDAGTVATSTFRNRLSGGPLLALHGYGYSWNEILPDLYRAGYRVFHIPPVPCPPPEPGSLPLPDHLFRPHCSCRGVDTTGIVRERYVPILERCMAIITGMHGPIDRVLQDRKPAALLISTKTGCRDHQVAAVARRRGIPVLSWQHGAQGINEAPIMPYVEMAGSDLHLSYGEGVRRVFRAAEERFGCRILPAGSAELERIAALQSRKNPRYRVLYATTNCYENNLYVSSPSLLQDNELFRSQKAILSVLGKSGAAVAFKLHGGAARDAHLREWVAARGYDQVTIFKQQVPFPALLADAGVVVLDFPSTTLLQALAARKPVLVLTRHLALTREAQALLRRCAWCSDDLDRFTGMIGEYLEGGLPAAVQERAIQAFLECYGTGPRGSVAERAIAILGEAVRKAGQ